MLIPQNNTAAAGGEVCAGLRTVARAVGGRGLGAWERDAALTVNQSQAGMPGKRKRPGIPGWLAAGTRVCTRIPAQDH